MPVEGVENMKTLVRKSLAILLILLGFAGTAEAHPHMFFRSTAQFIMDGEGRLSKLRVVFLVDELNTIYTFAELGVNQDGDQTLTEEETEKVATTILEGFGHYNYFTHLRHQDASVALGKPLGVTVQIQQRQLGLSFMIPLQTPLDPRGKSLALKLYDPTYFTAVTIDLPPTVIGKGANCSVSVVKPAETVQTRTSQQLLSQLSREQTPEVEDVGVLFAETTRLTCKR